MCRFLPRPEHRIVEQMFGAADSVAVRFADPHVHCRFAQMEPRKVADGGWNVGGGVSWYGSCSPYYIAAHIIA